MKRPAAIVFLCVAVMAGTLGTLRARDQLAQRPVTQCLDISREARAPHGGMVHVPSGDYTMGDDAYPEDGPPRHARIAGFWMDRHEVTNAEFSTFVKATGYITQAERNVDAQLHPDLPLSMRRAGAMVFVMPKEVGDMSDISQWWHYVAGANWRHPAGPGSSIAWHANFPVVEITYADALAYAQWKGRAFPTEAEWEWAARGADPKAHADHDQPKHANSWQGVFPVFNSGEDGFTGLAPAGCYAPNRLGLYDMIGNVWEWTSSVFAPGSYTIKGGSYLCSPDYCMRYRSGARQPQEADLAASHLGFRTILRDAH